MENSSIKNLGELTPAEIKDEARERWSENRFLEQGATYKFNENFNFLPWVDYEDYMQAKLIDSTSGETGRIIVNFPSESSEDNQLHVHPISDRVITVIEGGGTFIALRKRELIRKALKPGTRVWMPRGVLHTFLSDTRGLLVESIHNPWVPLEDEKCLIYPSKKIHSIK